MTNDPFGDLTLDEDPQPPPGVRRITVGAAVKLSRAYNSFEASFSAEFELPPGINPPIHAKQIAEVETWVRSVVRRGIQQVMKENS